MYSLLLIVMGVPTVLDTFDLPQQCNYVLLEKMAADSEGEYACRRSDGTRETLSDDKVTIRRGYENYPQPLRYNFTIRITE